MRSRRRCKMVMYKIVYDKRAIKEIQKLKSSNLDKKTKSLIDILRLNPYQSPPPYEKLIGDLQGAYSRRINIQHRLVYQILEDIQKEKKLAGISEKTKDLDINALGRNEVSKKIYEKFSFIVSGNFVEKGEIIDQDINV